VAGKKHGKSSGRTATIFTQRQEYRCPAVGETVNILRRFPTVPEDPHIVITKNPMTAQERRTIASLAVVYCSRMLGLFMVLPLLALYAADLPGSNESLIGLAMGIYGGMQAVLQIPLGWLSDQIGRKPVIFGGLVVFALGSVVAAMATSIGGIIVGRMLQGAGAISSTVMALVADLTREEQRTKAMAVIGISIGLSFGVALVCGPVMAAHGGLPAVFWFTAALSLVCITMVVTMVPASPRVSRESAGVGAPGLIRQSLHHPVLLRLNFGVFAVHFILTASFLVVPGMLEQSYGIDRAHHWYVYLPVMVLSLLGMVPMMTVAERGGRLRQIFLLGIALILVGVAIFGYAGSKLWFYFGLWLFFVGFNYMEATLPSAVSKTVSVEAKGTAMGIYSTCQFLGAFAGGAGGGWLLHTLGEPALIAACLLVTAAWWVLVLQARRTAGGKTITHSAVQGI
jgi:MFS family permease